MSDAAVYLMRKFMDVLDAVNRGDLDSGQVADNLDELLAGVLPAAAALPHPPRKENWYNLFDALGIESSLMSQLDAYVSMIRFLQDSELTPREQEMLRQHYAVDGPAETQHQIAQRFDVTPGRAKAIIEHALEKIRRVHNLSRT